MKNWKQTLLASASGVVLAGSAYAADLPMKGAAPMAYPPVVNWTGPYIGAHIGAAGSQNTCTAGAGGGDYSCSTDYYHNDIARDIGFLGGVQAGYDFQDGFFVYGIAADWSWTNLKTSAYNMSGSVSYESKVNWLASFRGRAGLAVDTTYLYLTGGVAVGEFKETPGVGTGEQFDSWTDTQVGWVAGAGVEHRFDRNWSGTLEYLHYDFGTVSKTHTADNGSYTYHHDFSHVVDAVRVGLNYRW